MTERLRQAPPAWQAFALALIPAAVLFLLYVVNAATIHGHFLDINQEGNPFTWYRSELFFVAALACGVAWWGGRANRIWAGLAVAMLFFSFDDIVMLHERSEDIGGLKHIALAVEAAAGLVILLAALGAIRALPRRSASFLVAALLLLVAGESAGLLSDALSPLSALPDHALIMVEQGCELLTGACVLSAAVEPAAAAIQAWR